jgi:hypothetical protein
LSYTMANYILNKKSKGDNRERKRSHGETADWGQKA